MALINFTLHRDADGQPIHDPFAAYVLANVDNTTPGLTYYLSIDPAGRWRILKEDTAAGTYRMATGGSNYLTAWANRASLGYDYPYRTGW